MGVLQLDDGSAYRDIGCGLSASPGRLYFYDPVADEWVREWCGAEVVDSFTDTNGTLLSAHTADEGGGPWVAMGRRISATTTTTQTANIQSGRLQSTSTTVDSQGYYHPYTPTSGDYDVSADFYIGDITGTARWEISGRIDSTTIPYARIHMSYLSTNAGLADGAHWRLAFAGAGTSTFDTYYVDYPAGTTVRATLEMRGDNLRGLVDGVEILSSSSALRSSGLAGAAGPRSAAGYVDNFEVREAGGYGHPIVMWDGTQYVQVACMVPAP